jgi:uncharacterized secreted repeat protein (TIGR03808 family)
MAARPAQAFVDAYDVGLIPDSSADQTEALTRALNEAVLRRRPLLIPAGRYRVSALPLPGGVTVIGVEGETCLVAAGAGPVARIAGISGVTLEGLSFSTGTDGPSGDGGLLELEASTKITINRCRFNGSRGNGIYSYASGATIEHCDFSGHRGAAIYSCDGKGIIATNNSITACGDGGIVIQGSAPGQQDGSILVGNTISKSGDDGQNGNGIHIVNADRVIIADNEISDCASAAVRLEGAVAWQWVGRRGRGYRR